MNHQPLHTLDLIRRANRRKGQHWFSPDAMRFFRSRIGETVHFVDRTGGAYFVSSERYDDSTPRRYTVRYASPDGGIHEASEFQQFASNSAAHAAALRLARHAREFAFPRSVHDVPRLLSLDDDAYRTAYGVIEINLSE